MHGCHIQLDSHRDDPERYVTEPHAQEPVELAEHHLPRDNQHPQRRLGDDELERLVRVVENFLPPYPRRDSLLEVVGAVGRGDLRQDAPRVPGRLDQARHDQDLGAADALRLARAPVDIFLDTRVPAPELRPPPAVDGLHAGEQV